jgi:hypothetical protein
METLYNAYPGGKRCIGFPLYNKQQEDNTMKRWMVKEIRQALQDLGVHGQVKAHPRGAVYVDGIYYGVYDYARHAFVD